MHISNSYMSEFFELLSKIDYTLWFNYTVNLWWQESANCDHKWKTPHTIAIYSNDMKQWSMYVFHPKKMRMLNEQTKHETDENFLRMEKNRQQMCKWISQKVRERVCDYYLLITVMVIWRWLTLQHFLPFHKYSKSHHAQ